MAAPSIATNRVEVSIATNAKRVGGDEFRHVLIQPFALVKELAFTVVARDIVADRPICLLDEPVDHAHGDTAVERDRRAALRGGQIEQWLRRGLNDTALATSIEDVTRLRATQDGRDGRARDVDDDGADGEDDGACADALPSDGAATTSRATPAAGPRP